MKKIKDKIVAVFIIVAFLTVPIFAANKADAQGAGEPIKTEYEPNSYDASIQAAETNKRIKELSDEVSATRMMATVGFIVVISLGVLFYVQFKAATKTN